MPKTRIKFVCQQCGAESPRWMGKCNNCGAWNSYVETLEAPTSGSATRHSLGQRSAPTPLPAVESDTFHRLAVGMEEFSRVLGGGIVPGSLVLIGGDPGIGKSTLLIEVAAQVADSAGPVLYVSGEESPQQIKMRAGRLGITGPALYVLAETNLGLILEQMDALKPRLVIIDSIQTVYVDELETAAGSVGQLRECAVRLMHAAKGSNVPIFLIGHVTKEGAIAGPRVLEHIVDTVLYLEGERFQSYRLLRAVKNRFGSTNEVGVFEMREEGMVEVKNASEVFLAERSLAPGSAILVTVEGTRPLLVECQALTSTTSFGLPRRTANGIDFNRLLIMTAVLSKRVGLGLSNQDIFVNVVGGMQVDEPAADLGTALAIASSFRDIPVQPDMVALGEVGLSGELRSVSQIEKRLHEAAMMGFKRCLLPQSMKHSKLRTEGLEIVTARSLADALDIALVRGSR
jgi:DNA repair protein RadA/Sms